MFTAQKEAWDADEGVIDSWDQLEVPDQPVPQKVKQEMRMHLELFFVQKGEETVLMHSSPGIYTSVYI